MPYRPDALNYPPRRCRTPSEWMKKNRVPGENGDDGGGPKKLPVVGAYF